MELGLLVFLPRFGPGLMSQLSSSASPCAEGWADPCLPSLHLQLLIAQGSLAPGLAGSGCGVSRFSRADGGLTP